MSDQIITLLHEILERLPAKKPEVTFTPSLPLQITRLKKMFEKLYDMEKNQKEDQKFPKCLHGSIKAVPYSILKNRCLHLKTFTGTDFDVVMNASGLILAPLGKAVRNDVYLKKNSNVIVVWSREAALKYGIIEGDVATEEPTEPDFIPQEPLPLDWLNSSVVKPTLTWNDEEFPLQPEPDLESNKDEEEELESEIEL